jgi:hypothetical protein
MLAHALLTEAVWRLVDWAGAMRWLVEHPDQPDADDHQGDVIQKTLWR